MKTFLFISLFLPHLAMAQINLRSYEVMQRQKYYKTGDWSAWLGHEKAAYRTQWGLNPYEDTYKDQVDLNFEIRNDDTVNGWWEIQVLKCGSDEIITQRLIALDVNELKAVTFLVPNCGTMEAPLVHYKIRRMIKID